jgi:ABC-2 type transport system ATP-binding protein
MNDPAIQIQGLTRDFGSARAVDGLTLGVPAGTVFGFLGPNGAGKTTTIRLLLGLLEPTAGQATVLGFDVRTQGDEIRQRTGALLEHPGHYERLSAEDNLEFYGRVWRLPAGERRERIRELLTHLELWERRDEAVSTWSRGMRQKLGVARALLHRPDLVFMDEPTAGLDPLAAGALRADLSTLAAREGVTVFLTTHNLSEAERVCDRVGVIHKGRLLAVGPPDELRSRNGAPWVEIAGRGLTPEIAALLQARPEVTAAALGEEGLRVELRAAEDVAPLVSLLVGRGVEVEEVRRGKASLEEVFVTLVEEGQ